jgi:hypothetical protein
MEELIFSLSSFHPLGEGQATTQGPSHSRLTNHFSQITPRICSATADSGMKRKIPLQWTCVDGKKGMENPFS